MDCLVFRLLLHSLTLVSVENFSTLALIPMELGTSTPSEVAAPINTPMEATCPGEPQAEAWSSNFFVAGRMMEVNAMMLKPIKCFISRYLS